MNVRQEAEMWQSRQEGKCEKRAQLTVSCWQFGKEVLPEQQIAGTKPMSPFWERGVV